MIYNNVLEAIGHTPIIRLNKIVDDDSAEILVKFEGSNIGGSIKTRTAYNMICDAMKAGKITKDTIIVEPTSGNQGIGLALCGAVMGIKTVIIMPDSVSEERRKLVRHYGADVVIVHDAGNIGECINECLKTAMKMAEENENVFIPQQFENPSNPLVHKHHTGVEILEQVAGPIHGFCSGIGTGGTISGIGEVLRAQNPDIEIWAVEPENAAILAGGSIGTHIQMGIGDGLIPKVLNQDIYNDICIISDEEALKTSRELAEKYKEKPEVCNAIGSHHEETEMTSIISPLVMVGDAISGARPGARREVIESYIKRLKDMENIAKSYPGVTKTYAIQAGRELRVIVGADQVTDQDAESLSMEIAKKIQEEMVYPGQVKITVIRETRSVAFAK